MSRGREEDRTAPAGGPAVPASRATSFTLAVVAACVGLVVIDVGLVLRNRALRRRVEALTHAVHAAEPRPLVDGEPLPALSAWDADGARLSLASSPAYTATLLYVSSDACDLCATVRPLWEELAERSAGSHVRVLELVVDGTPATLHAREAPYPLARAGDDVWALTSRLPGLPAALLLDEAGSVTRAFYGEELTGLREAVEDLLLVR